MAISGSDLVHYESSSTGSSGGAINTSNPITSGVKNNVWPDVTDGERVAGLVRYRKTFYKNNNLTDAAVAPVIYNPVLPANATYEMGLGTNSSSDDDATQGNMSAFTGAANVALVSDGTDTRSVTIRGMNAGGTAAQQETVALNSMTEVLTAAQFSKVWSVTVASTSGTRTITIKQGSGGTTRGTIGVNKITCWLWVVAGTAKASGIYITDLAAGQNVGLWRKMTIAPGAPATRPNTLTTQIEES